MSAPVSYEQLTRSHFVPSKNTKKLKGSGIYKGYKIVTLARNVLTSRRIGSRGSFISYVRKLFRKANISYPLIRTRM